MFTACVYRCVSTVCSGSKVHPLLCQQQLLGREESDDPNPMHGAKGQQLPSENCFLLCTLAHAPADPKTSEEGPWQTSSHSTVL